MNGRRASACGAVFLGALSNVTGCSSARPLPLRDDVGSDGGAQPDGSTSGSRGLTPAAEAALDAFIADHMKVAHVPGLAVALVAHGNVAWTKGYGMASLADNRAVTSDTLFMLASVSKTFVGVAMMQLVEAKQIALDDDIDGKLPFAVRNPSFPTAKITYRMLLTHTSSLVDGAAFGALAPTQGSDAPTPLADWIKGYVLKGGAYSAADNWGTAAPGAHYSYSNAGASLAGYLVEIISGMSLQNYCQAHIFGPLKMGESSWFLKGLDSTHIAHPYEWVKGAYVDKGFYGFPDYPDGQLRTSASQLARFLAMFASGGSYDGATSLAPATVQEMRKRQVPRLGADAANQGLIWYYTMEVDGTEVLGHTGAYIGVSTDMYFDPKTNNGYVLLTNGGVYLDHAKGPEVDAMYAIDVKLLATAADF